MTDDADRTSGPAEDEEARRRALRPNPTLDLDATDVSPSGAGPGDPGPPPEPGRAETVPPAPRPSLAGHVAAAIAGALLAVIAVYWLDSAALMPQRPSDQSAENARQIGALTRNVEGIQHRIADIDRKVTAPPAPATDQQARQEIGGVERTVADLHTRFGALEQKFAELDKRLGQIAGVAGKPLPNDLQQLPARVGELSGALDALSKRIDTALAGKASADDVQKLDRNVQNLAQTLAAEQRAQRQSDTAEVAAEARASSALAAVAALDGAVARSAPYDDILAGVRRLLPGIDLGPLAAYAAHGAPSLAILRSRLAANLAAAPPPAPPANAGFFDRLFASARALVRITPVHPRGEDIAGDSADARRARVIAALDRGDDAAALKAWDALDPAARKSSQPEAEALRRRLAVADSLTALRRRAVEALNAAGTGTPPPSTPARPGPAPAEGGR